MSIKQINNQTYDFIINIKSCIDQEELKRKIRELPEIPFTHLLRNPPPLHHLELLQEAKELACSSEDNQEEKIGLLEKSFSLYKKFIKMNRDQISQKTVRSAAREAVFIGADLVDVLDEADKKEAMKLAIKKLQIISGFSEALHQNNLNQSKDALNIPQKHFAVTSQPLGTTNVKDCIFLILRNRKTYTTFAGHIDRNTDADSITDAIKKYMPQDDPMDGYIIGGHLSSDSCISDHDLINVSKVSRLLFELHKTGYVFESRWWILQQNTPINIIYDPTQDQFFEAVPKTELPSYSPREILIYLDRENKKLLPFFIEEQQTEAQCSIDLSPLVQKKLHQLLNDEGRCSKVKILETIWHDLPTNLRIYTQCKTISNAYSEALDKMTRSVKELSPNTCNTTIKKAVAHVIDSNRDLSLYMLPFSIEKNFPIINKTLDLLYELSS